MIRPLHDEVTVSVICEGEQKVGVKQGCVIAPTLFGLFMGALLQVAKVQEDMEVR